MDEEKKFWLKRLYLNKEVPFHVYGGDGSLIHTEGIGEEETDPFASDPAIYDAILEKLREKRHPLIFTEERSILYIAFVDEEENLYIGGPVCHTSAEEQKSVMYHYRRRHSLPGKFRYMPRLDPPGMANLLAMALAVFCGNYVDELAILTENGIEGSEEKQIDKEEQLEWELEQYFFESSEQSREHVGYEYERDLLDDVRSGRMERFETSVPDDMYLLDRVGKMAENRQKQIEYMIAATITLMGRAAMEGGVPTDTAYAVSDLYFQKLEKCRNAMEMLKINMEVQKKFTSLVKKHKENKNSTYVEQCKDIIARHIHKGITVEEIARQIGISRTYLSTKFAEETGMSISRYSVQVRLRAAENMLKYSEASISEIAEYLCFSSQSYFGKKFKEKNGISPAEYRRQNKVLDFVSR